MWVKKLLFQTEVTMEALEVLCVSFALEILITNTRNCTWITDMSVETNNRISFPSFSVCNRLLGMLAHACSQVKQGVEGKQFRN